MIGVMMTIKLKPIFSCATVLLWCDIGMKELQAQTGEEKAEAPNFSIFDEDVMSSENDAYELNSKSNDSQNNIPSNGIHAQGGSALHPQAEDPTHSQEKKGKKKDPFEWWDEA